MVTDTAFAAMRAQAVFENGKGEENQSLYAWLCAEIDDANVNGLDFITRPSRPPETLKDYNKYKLMARQLSIIRALDTTSRIKVA